MRLLQFLFLVGACRSCISAKAVGDTCDPAKDKCADLDQCVAPTEHLTVPKDVILVLGNTGSGKSTLTKHLTGVDNDLKSVGEFNTFMIHGKRIGSTIQSFTEVPDLMTDASTGENFYDCPGFEDIRGSCIEVSTTFYMKDITRHAKQVKILLLTPHFAVKKGQDRKDFVTMLMHAARILKNADKLQNSIALIVTKADSNYIKVNGSYVPVPEGMIRTGVVNFLRDDVIPFLIDMAKSAVTEEEESFLQAIRLVQIFLTQNEGEYKNIGIFRIPDEEGPLSGIEMMETGRNRLRDLVYDNLRYSAVEPSDFGFSVSPRTKLFALQRTRRLSEAIDSQLSALSANLTASFSQEAYDPTNVPKTVKRFDEYSAKVRDFATDLESSPSVQDFASRLAKDFSDTPQQLQAVKTANETNYLDVLQVVSSDALVDKAVLVQWSQKIGKAATDLANRRDWYSFLVSLYDRLSQHDVQESRQGYYEVLLGLSGAPRGLPSVTEDKLPAFLTRVARSLGTHTQQPQPGVANLTDLNALLDRVLRHGLEHQCRPDGRLVVTGETVLLSQAVAAPPCPGASGSARSIEIYALNTVFVDQDVVLEGGSLVVVAPTWQVLGGQRRISLEGRAAAAKPRKPAEAGPGQVGTNGQPGQPGAQGGSFLGVGAQFVRGDMLSVSVKGGDGGGGQDGGDGGPGRTGGGNGGNGGNGGVGGLGGHGGTARVISVEKNVSLRVKLHGGEGNRGAGGRGGAGGDSRPHSWLWLSRRKRDFGATFAIILAVGAIAGIGTGIYKAVKDPPAPPAPPVPVYYNGGRGADDAVSRGLQQPSFDEDQQRAWVHVPAEIRKYLELNLQHPYRSEQLRHFLSQTETSRELQQLSW